MQIADKVSVPRLAGTNHCPCLNSFLRDDEMIMRDVTQSLHTEDRSIISLGKVIADMALSGLQPYHMGGTPQKFVSIFL